MAAPRQPRRAERPERHQDRDDRGAADRDDDDADPERVGDAEPVQQHEEQQRAGRVAGDVGVPVVGRVHRDVVDERLQHRADRADALGVVDVLSRSLEDAREPIGALGHRQRHGPQPGRRRTRMRGGHATTQRRPAGEARATGPGRSRSPATSGRPNRGSQSACSGGQCTRTSSSVQRGTTDRGHHQHQPGGRGPDRCTRGDAEAGARRQPRCAPHVWAVRRADVTGPSSSVAWRPSRRAPSVESWV